MEDVILDNQPVSVVVTKNGGVKLKMLGWGWHLYKLLPVCQSRRLCLIWRSPSAKT